jgi:putative pre-16S rRNA nuclease
LHQTWREIDVSAISGTSRLRLSSGMPLTDPRELSALIPRGKRLLGLDVGSKTIGTALSDTRLVIASPLETVRRRGRWSDDAAALLALIDRHDIGGLVIGLPLALSGGEAPRSQSVRQFARNLLALRDLPMAFWDERLSTAAVTREMIAHDMTRKRRAAIVDRVAAAYILQGCLDAIGQSS